MSPSPVKAQILEVATRLMAVRGYHRTSLDDVLRESGAGKGSFYHHFRSKEDLGYAILDRLLERFGADPDPDLRGRFPGPLESDRDVPRRGPRDTACP
jgi:TetR/AcrR family transcriptional repressor of nem operon